MKWIDIKNKQMDVLEKDLAEARSKIVDFKFKVQSGALKQVHEIGKVKKDIAMIILVEPGTAKLLNFKYKA